jgi:undecaprenyldiphospho-muramoylpentapeptide beta-N-acetylglucosaminyltransferase
VRVLIAAGGTGGHVYPALVVAEELRRRGHHVEFVGVGRAERTLVPVAGFELHTLPGRGLPRSVSPRALLAGVDLTRAVVLARGLLRRTTPDVVLGMGGYPALAPTIAARMRGVPVVLHEGNALLSLANRLAVPWARALALSLPLASAPPRARRVETTGNPVRATISELADADDAARGTRRAAAAFRLGLDPGRTTVLAFGGSQGAQALNEALPVALRDVDVQVLHLTGPAHEARVRAAWAGRAVVLSYLAGMEDAYAVADLVVSRSGASTVAELTVLGLPSVLVPLPQRRDPEANARTLEANGAASIVLQAEGFVQRLGAAVRELLDDRGRRTGMSAAAKALGRPDAAERLADLVETAG